jgi:hypothetical protein
MHVEGGNPLVNIRAGNLGGLNLTVFYTCQRRQEKHLLFFPHSVPLALFALSKTLLLIVWKKIQISISIVHCVPLYGSDTINYSVAEYPCISKDVHIHCHPPLHTHPQTPSNLCVTSPF